MSAFNIQLPNITDNSLNSAKERKAILEALYQTNEQLRYVLNNIGEENLSTELQTKIETASNSEEITRRIGELSDKSYSFFKQTKEQFQLVVYKDGVISSINLSPEGIAIKASKISLEGYVSINGKFSVDTSGNMHATGGTMGGWSISSGKITSQAGGMTLDGNTGTITSGTINGSEINGVTMNTSELNSVDINTATLKSSNIESATITGGTINGTTLNSNVLNSAVINSGSLYSGYISGTTIDGGKVNGAIIMGGSVLGAEVAGGSFYTVADIYSDGSYTVNSEYPCMTPSGVDSPTIYTKSINAGSGYGSRLTITPGADIFGSLYVSSTVTCTEVINSSDERKKFDIAQIPGETAAEIIAALNPVTFRYVQGDTDQKHYGFIAQEVPEDMRRKTADGYYALNYSEMIAPLVKTVQRQEQRIQALENKLAEMGVA